MSSPAASHASITGRIMGGQQPVKGSLIEVYTVGTSSDGGAATPLIAATVTTSDGTGVANSNANAGNWNNTLPAGSFDITADYACADPNELVYITAMGGDPGVASANSAIQLVSAIGTCQTLQNIPYITVNEITTVGTAAALLPYMTAFDSVGSTPANAAALRADFALANEYYNPIPGTAPGAALPSGYYASTVELNTLADILATCINSTDPASPTCSTLFTAAQPPSGAAPSDVLTAVLDILNHPGNNVSALFDRLGTTPPFQPTLASAPAAWTLPIVALATPSLSLSSAATTTGDTTPVILIATTSDTADAIAVTFSLGSSLDGSLSATTCTTAAGSCTVTYTPSGALAAGTYSVAFTASFAASASYNSASASSALIVSSTTPTTSVPVNLTLETTGSSITHQSLIQASDGNYYGTGSAGGANGGGTLFRLTPGAGGSVSLQVIHDFAASGASTTDGNTPYGVMQGRDGFLYGVTTNGGASNLGAVYKVALDGTGFTLVHSIISTEGSHLLANVVQGSDGRLYGTTASPAKVFAIDLTDSDTSSNLTVLASLNSVGGTAGLFNSYAPLLEASNGYFYGTTSGATAPALGGAFRLLPDGTNLSGRSFTPTPTTGGRLQGGFVQSPDGLLYGTMVARGASSRGTIFTFDLTSSFNYSTPHSFSTAEGSAPSATMFLGSDGKLYGTTTLGGTSNNGTFFKYTPGADSVVTLKSFTSATDGSSPAAGVVQGSDGSFLVPTATGGPNGGGSISRIAMDPAGLPAPVQLSAPATVTAGASFTLRYLVTNAYSKTLQSCFITETDSSTAASTVVSSYVTASATSYTDTTLTAPANAGAYTYALTCGGQESGFATVTVQ